MKNLKIFLTYCLIISNSCFSQNSAEIDFLNGEKYYNNMDFERSILSFQKAVNLFIQKNDSNKLCKCYIFIALIHANFKNYSSAEKYGLLANNIANKYKNDTLSLHTTIILGGVLTANNKKAGAIRFYNSGLDLAEKLKDNNSKVSILNNLGVLYNNQENYNMAIESYDKALSLSRHLKNKHNEALSLVNMGLCYSQSKQYTRAFELIKKAIDLAKEIGNLEILKTGYLELSYIKKVENNFKKAYEYLDLYVVTTDTATSLEIDNKVRELEVRYQLQQKEIEIAGLNTQKQKDEIDSLRSKNRINTLQYTLCFSAIFLIIISLVSILYFVQYRKKLKLSKDLKASKDELELRNRALNNALKVISKLQNALKQDLKNYKELAYRKQMNPHFIFNCLNSVQNYILTNNKLAANYYLGELSTLIRRVLENSEKEFISLREELFISETYIKLEQKRFDNKFQYKLLLDESIKTDDVKIPPLILQPFIENAIWHGLMHKNGAANLDIIVFRRMDASILITVKDNGVGRDYSKKNKPKDWSKKESMGLNLAYKRITVGNFLMERKIDICINDLFDDNKLSLGTEVLILLENEGA